MDLLDAAHSVTDSRRVRSSRRNRLCCVPGSLSAELPVAVGSVIPTFDYFISTPEVGFTVRYGVPVVTVHL